MSSLSHAPQPPTLTHPPSHTMHSFGGLVRAPQHPPFRFSSSIFFPPVFHPFEFIGRRSSNVSEPVTISLQQPTQKKADTHNVAWEFGRRQTRHDAARHNARKAGVGECVCGPSLEVRKLCGPSKVGVGCLILSSGLRPSCPGLSLAGRTESVPQFW